MFWKEAKRVRKGEQARDVMVKDVNCQILCGVEVRRRWAEYFEQVLNVADVREGSFHVQWTNFKKHPHFTISNFVNILPIASIPSKLGSAKFQFQIINGWCTIITNVEVTFVPAGFFTINSKV